MTNRAAHNPPSRLRRAFTLIELLIVIALTAVLFTLLLAPLISALRYTKQAQIVTAAQDAARITRERITRELGSAVFVFDNTSHPFLIPAGTQVASGDDRYTNFLDLPIRANAAIDNKPATGPGQLVVAHAYNAKLDFVLPRLNEQGKATDPTTGEPIDFRPSGSGSAIVSNPSYVFPLAAGTTMIRYWVGLKDPTKPYNNVREGRSSYDDSNDNTYVLYRAQFQPYKPQTNAAGKVTGQAPNADLFAMRPQLKPDGTPQLDASGKPVTIPELDDPDFFRYVNLRDKNGNLIGPPDPNWLNDTHATYTTAEADAHNKRVDKWLQIAKPVIPGPNVDLILLPHNSDNTLNYDAGTFDANSPCTATDTNVICKGVAHSGIARDPVTRVYYPVVNTSVTFRPATVSGDASPGTTSDYSSLGAPGVAGESGYPYIPTVYTANSRSWALPFHVSLYPANYDSTKTDGRQVSYDTGFAQTNTDLGSGATVNAGDILEYRHDGTTNEPTGTPVFDISQGYPLKDNGMGALTLGGTDFVPMTVNPDTGTINFTTPSLPKGPIDRNSRSWYYAYYDPNAATDPDTIKNGGVDPNGLIDLTKKGNGTIGGTLVATAESPLMSPYVAPFITTGTNTGATGVKNAHVAPGGIRVLGPDTTPGANYGQIVPYTEVSGSLTDPSALGGDQYIVSYANNTIQVNRDTANYLRDNQGASIQVVYDYQANMTLTDPTRAFIDLTKNPPQDNPYQPMQVKVDYQTRDLIDVSIGVRIYDISNNRAQVIPSETKVKIGNSNR